MVNLNKGFKDLTEEEKSNIKEYKWLSRSNRIVEHYVKIDNEWVDITEITKAQEELEDLKLQERRAKTRAAREAKIALQNKVEQEDC